MSYTMPDAVEAELSRAHAKFGVQDHGDLVWLTVLMEEVGEAAQAILDARFRGVGAVGGTYECDHLTREIAQVVAVGIRWLEARGRALGGAE